MASGAPVQSIFVTATYRGDAAIEALVAAGLAAGARVFDLAAGVMEKVADTVTPQPICAIVESGDVPLGDMAAGRPGGACDRLVVVCVEVRDPGNFGAVMRSASASGAAGIVACDGCVDPYNPKAVRASAGSIFTLPLVKGGEPLAVLGVLRSAGYALWGTRVGGGVDYLQAALDGDVALVLGNEANGLPQDLDGVLDGSLTIPMAAGNESLNVAMSATVLCFEAARQRRDGPPALGG